MPHTIELPTTAHSARSARRFVDGLLERFPLADEEGETLRLLVSELVTNAIQHGGPHAPTARIAIRVDASPGCVRVEVTDCGDGEPRLGDGAIDRRSGRGLLIVDALASRWGHDRLPLGKTVWFELPTPSRNGTDGSDTDGSDSDGSDTHG